MQRVLFCNTPPPPPSQTRIIKNVDLLSVINIKCWFDNKKRTADSTRPPPGLQPPPPPPPPPVACPMYALIKCNVGNFERPLRYLGFLTLLLIAGGGRRWSDLRSELELKPQLSGYSGSSILLIADGGRRWSDLRSELELKPQLSGYSGSSILLIVEELFAFPAVIKRTFEGIHTGSMRNTIWRVVCILLAIGKHSF